MTHDRSTPAGSEADGADAAHLGRSYGAIMTPENWQVDVGVPPVEETVAPSSPPSVERIVEALLFIGGTPLTADHGCETIRGLTPDEFTRAIDVLNREYRRQARPYVVRLQEDGYVLALRPRYLPLRDRLYGGTREARLSPSAIDVLALVAYRQPATKHEIDSIRGNDSSAILRQLVRRGLIAVIQRADGQRRQVSYGTTPRFLELFGLSSIDDLPQTQDLQML